MRSQHRTAPRRDDVTAAAVAPGDSRAYVAHALRWRDTCSLRAVVPQKQRQRRIVLQQQMVPQIQKGNAIRRGQRSRLQPLERVARDLGHGGRRVARVAREHRLHGALEVGRAELARALAPVPVLKTTRGAHISK